jgi:hypothetical protein
MNKKEKDDFKLSYESDGLMGKSQKKDRNSQETKENDEPNEDLFFNTTQFSE